MGQSLLYLKHNSVCPYFLTVTYVYLVRRTLKNLFARSFKILVVNTVSKLSDFLL